MKSDPLPILVAIATVALVSQACGSRSMPESQRPDVLLLTLDTLRADRMSLYGHARPTTPFLEALAERGARFDRAYTASNITKPSHASILTGLYPKNHGIVTNHETLLNPAIETVAERFQQAGYRTVGVVATRLLNGARSGLDHGFERFVDAATPQRRAPEVVRDAVAALAEDPDRPFFAWLHFYDPHVPYDPPRKLLERFMAPAEDRVLLDIVPLSGDSMVSGTIPHSSAIAGIRDPAFYEAAYEAEIAFLDASLRRLFEDLAIVGLDRPLIVAVTADHGEMLGERGVYYNHASLYEPVARVPLILLAPGIAAGTAIDAIVETVDLAPTLLDLAGLGPAETLDGRSLLPLFADGASDRPAFSHHSHDLAISIRDANGTLLLPVPSSLDEVVTPFSRFKRSSYLNYIGLTMPVYLASGDPWTNRYEPEEPTIRALELELRRWYRQRRNLPRPEVGQLDEDARNELEALGYL